MLGDPIALSWLALAITVALGPTVRSPYLRTHGNNKIGPHTYAHKRGDGGKEDEEEEEEEEEDDDEAEGGEIEEEEVETEE